MLVLLDLDIPWEDVDEGPTGYLGVVLQVFVLLYSFMGLAIICDDHLVPALDTLCIVWQIPEDVAGATFMAFGSAAPEIVIAAVATIQTTMGSNDDDEAAADKIALGVSSVVGSGLIAFSLIPAVCGLSQESGVELKLKRRPLLRDECGYLFSLLGLMYTIADGIVHAWEAAVLVIIYVLYLLVIVFSSSIRKWYIEEILGQEYFSSNKEHEQELLGQSDYEDEGLETLDQGEVWGPPVYVSFKQRPLGFRCQPGEDGKNAIVASIENGGDQEDPEFIKTGSQIMEIAGRSCLNRPFEEIEHDIHNIELPLIIKFQQPPQDSIHTWSNARVKQWWAHGLPPACQQYIHVVDDCQLDGSDLLDLDWQMLEEFEVKKIHGMKILKAIKNLMGAKQLLGTEIQRVMEQLERWDVSGVLIDDVKADLLGKGTGDRRMSQGSDAHGHGKDDHGESDSEEHGVGGKIWHFFAVPLEALFGFTCPECEVDTPTQNLYPVTFLISFVWVAVFSFCLSSVVERWVTVTGVPMAFFGLLLVSLAAQVPDTLESLAVARKGYGSMAVSNCLGTQTINIGLGLGFPWLITASTGAVTELDHDLLIPCWFMLFMLIMTLCIYGFDMAMGYPKVVLTRAKAWLLVFLYFGCIAGYGIYLVAAGKW